MCAKACKYSTWYTDKKENKIFLIFIYKEIHTVSGAKVIYEEGLPNTVYEEMRKYFNISPYMRRPGVIYDFAPDPSKFLNIYFLFYECTYMHNFLCPFSVG
jgi:hypothetical protein